MTKEKIERIGILEQNLSSIVIQRQTFQKQILELDYANSELKNKDEAYQIVGTIMIKKSASELQKSISEKKEIISVKIESIIKQEKILRTQLQELQNSVITEMNQKGD